MNHTKTQVVFTKTNAYVLFDNKKGIKSGYLVLTNPKILCADCSTHYWKMGRNNTVVEMSEAEKQQRLLDIETYGTELDENFFMPEKSLGAPVSKPIVIQEIKNTPVLHIETKEVRHLDLRPIGSLELDRLSINPVDVAAELKAVDINKIDLEVMKVAPVTIESCKVEASLDKVQVNPIDVKAQVALSKLHLDSEPVQLKDVNVNPIEIKPIQVIFPKSLEVMELLNTLIMFSLLMYVLFRK